MTGRGANAPPFRSVARPLGGEESFLPKLGGNVMQNSVWYRGESLTRLLQGVAVGAIATLVIGFGWGGWMLGGSAKTLADNTASSAVVAAIAPICVDQFQRSADATNNLTELKKANSWQQAAYVEKGRLGGDAWQQGGRFRRAPGMRRSAQQPEIGSGGKAEHEDRWPARRSRRSPAIDDSSVSRLTPRGPHSWRLEA